MEITRYSDYDLFASIYDKYWANDSLVFIPVIEKLILENKDKGINILDLCCGTGPISKALFKKGYNLTGIDSSKEMIARAKMNSPEIDFSVEDARTFNFTSKFDIVISMYDSLNHIVEIDHLGMAFINVYNSLKEDGVFLFDLNMEEAYINNWVNHQSNIVEEELVCATRCFYESNTKTGKFETTVFQMEKSSWERSEIVLRQKCYSEKEIVTSLKSAGFASITVLDAKKDLGLNFNGRNFFKCEK